MAKSSTTAGKPDKAEAKAADKAAKAARKASSKERRGQIWQAFKMQRKEDNKLLPLMIGALLLSAVVITGLGWLVGLPWWAALPFGIIIGALVAMIIFSRRVQANVYKKAEGQPGAAGWMLQNNLRGRWRITPGVAGTTQLDAVHRVIGRPGVVLVGEGAPHRVKPLIAQEKKRIARVVGETPIYDFVVGNDEGQIPLSKLNARLIKLPRNIAANSVTELDNRLSALTARAPQAGLPKGPLPAGAKVRSVQRAARRR
jgi:hypothetical protein